MKNETKKEFVCFADICPPRPHDYRDSYSKRCIHCDWWLDFNSNIFGKKKYFCFNKKCSRYGLETLVYNEKRSRDHSNNFNLVISILIPASIIFVLLIWCVI